MHIRIHTYFVYIRIYYVCARVHPYTYMKECIIFYSICPLTSISVYIYIYIWGCVCVCVNRQIDNRFV